METNIRNKNQSYKPIPEKIAYKARLFMDEVITEHEKTLHPDEIVEIVTASIRNVATFKIALSMDED